MEHSPTTPPESAMPAQDPADLFPAARLAQQEVAPINHGRDMNLPLITTLVLAGGMLVFIIITLTQAWFMHIQAQEREEKSYSQVNYELADLQQRQQANLKGYRWMDGDNHQVVAVPIERAMELTIEHYRKQAVEE